MDSNQPQKETLDVNAKTALTLFSLAATIVSGLAKIVESVNKGGSK